MNSNSEEKYRIMSYLCDEVKSSRWPVRVMVIDDSPTIHGVIEICLSCEGFVVQSFSNGAEAIQWLKQPDALAPDLVFLNSVLPYESGYGVARALKSKPQFTHTAIIMLLYQNSAVDRLKARLAGAQGCLAIPFGIQNLLQVTQKILSASSSEKSTSTRVAISHEHSPLYVVWL